MASELPVRDLQREGPRRCRENAKDAEAALEGLVSRKIGSWVDVPTGGRPSRIFSLNGVATKGA
jgi:hypothetical protein